MYVAWRRTIREVLYIAWDNVHSALNVTDDLRDRTVIWIERLWVVVGAATVGFYIFDEKLHSLYYNYENFLCDRYRLSCQYF